MFKKVLVVEDLDVIRKGILKELSEIESVAEVVSSGYCDDALLKVIHARNNDEPFDLIITDLSFEKDHRPSTLLSGIDLVKKIKFLKYKVPIIVFSVEDRPSKVLSFLDNQDISGYVLKDRDGLKNLNKAIQSVAAGNKYISPKIIDSQKKQDTILIKSYDIQLIEFLSKGMSQVEISEHLARQKGAASSLSTIEKHLGDLKSMLRAKNVTQLVAHAKDLGLI